MYEIRWSPGTKEDISRLKIRANEIAQIVDEVDEQLTNEPQTPTKRKKIIRPEERLPFEHLDPVWQLRIGQFRVFYDVSEPEQRDTEEEYGGVVHIRAIRRKPPHKTTKEIL